MASRVPKIGWPISISRSPGPNEYTSGMTEAIHQHLSAEGADPLLLAGVHDANLIELQRSTGVKASLRGDTLILGGTAEQVERATPAVRAMIDRARAEFVPVDPL